MIPTHFPFVIEGYSVEEKKIKVGFKTPFGSFLLIASMDLLSDQIALLPQSVLHLNADTLASTCHFCQNPSHHRSPCLSLRDADDTLQAVLEKTVEIMESRA